MTSGWRWRIARWLVGCDIVKAPEAAPSPTAWIYMRHGETTVWMAVERIRIQKRNDIWRHTYGCRDDGRGYHSMDQPRGRKGRFVGTLA